MEANSGGTISDQKSALYDALGRADHTAIRTLADKIRPDVRKAVIRAGLAIEDAEELVNDILVITIANIRKKTFQHQDYHPAAYAMGVMRKLLANRIRAKKPRTEELDNIPHQSSLNPEAYFRDKERQKIVGDLLQRLGETCRKLLIFKYFNHYSDKEIVEKKLADFTSINSLKSKRSQCLRKLAEIARAAGIKEKF